MGNTIPSTFVGYPIRALLYDAQHGVNVSRLLVFEFYRDRVQRKQTIPPDVLEFVALELGKVLDADDIAKAAQRMFNAHAKKPTTAASLHRDMQIFGLTKHSTTGKLIDPNGKDISKATKAQTERETRIWNVQRLLDERDAASPDRQREITDELIAIYRNPSDLT